MRLGILGLFLTGIVITGCATPYQETGFTGGVSATPLNENTFLIKAQGNAFISAGTIQDYVLLKSAEVCRRHNFTHFVTLSEKDTTETVTYQNNTYDIRCSGYSCTATGGGSNTFSKPGTSMRIKLIRETDGIPGMAFRCSVIYDSLSSKYID